MITRKETLRYLGYESENVDENTLMLLDECEKLLLKTVRPNHTYKVFNLIFGEGCIIDMGVFRVESKVLKRNLSECSKVVIFAATLGPRVDILLQKYSKISSSKAVVLQASAASMLEDYIDEKEEILKEEFGEEGLFLRPRFSPGYGDLSLEYQKDIFRLLDLPRKIGATLTDNLIMAPSKTVTAFIGLSKVDKNVCDYK